VRMVHGMLTIEGVLRREFDRIRTVCVDVTLTRWDKGWGHVIS
jgi:hypothetical protein